MRRAVALALVALAAASPAASAHAPYLDLTLGC
jgi:hypothetical protein